MIRFRQKEFVGLMTALNIGSTALGIKNQMQQSKEAKQQAEVDNKLAIADAAQRKKESEMAMKAQQQQMKNQQKLTKVASKDPNTAAQALGEMQMQQPMQSTFSDSPNTGKTGGRWTRFRKGTKEVFEDLTTPNGKDGPIIDKNNLRKKILTTNAKGAMILGANYLVDKQIQRDARKAGLMSKGSIERTEKEKKARKRRLIGLGTTAAVLAGSTIAAKNNVFGNKAQNFTNKYINKNNFKKLGKETLQGLGESYLTVNRNGKLRPNALTIGLDAVGLVSPILRYKAAKDQLKEQQEESERDYSVVDKAANTAINGAISGGYNLLFKGMGNVLSNKDKMYELEKLKGKKIRGKFLRSVGREIKHIAIPRKVKDATGKTTFKAPRAISKFKQHPGESILSFISTNHGGYDRSQVSGFGEKLIKVGEAKGHETTKKIGEFVKNNPKTSIAASVLPGIAIAAATGIGRKRMYKGLKDIDKNAFRYSERGLDIDPEEYDYED